MDKHVSTSSSRRAILAAAAWAVAATAVSAVARPLPALAAGDDGSIIHVGDNYQDVRAPTLLRNVTNGNNVLSLYSGSGIGVYADSPSQIGVWGESFSGTGVIGISNTGSGIQGASGHGNGVHGHSDSATASGVYGDNPERGYGVAGRSNSPPLGTGGVFAAATLGDNTADGIGVWARSAHGIALFADPVNPDAVALKAQGVAQFERSGTLTVSAGTSVVTKSGIRIDPGTLVLATLQQNRAGVWIQSAVPNAAGDSFTIRLNKAVGGDTKVGWFLVN